MRTSMMQGMQGMQGMQRPMKGRMRLMSLTGNPILMRCVTKINSRIANARMCHMSHTCHMSQLHVPCHFDRVSDFLNFARLIVPKVIVLSIVKIAEAIARNCQKLKFKKCQNCGDVMFLITLIKCLKGHKSLGSLCYV